MNPTQNLKAVYWDTGVDPSRGASNSKSVASLQQLFGEQIRKQNPDK
jgi:hypothetical protein